MGFSFPLFPNCQCVTLSSVGSMYSKGLSAQILMIAKAAN